MYPAGIYSNSQDGRFELENTLFRNLSVSGTSYSTYGCAIYFNLGVIPYNFTGNYFIGMSSSFPCLYLFTYNANYLLTFFFNVFINISSTTFAAVF
jgi:hypothetical protein